MQRRQMLFTTGSAILGLSGFPLGWVAAEDKRKPTVLYFTKMPVMYIRLWTDGANRWPTREKILVKLGEINGFNVECSEDSTVFDSDVNRYDLLTFYTSGMPFTVRQMQNVLKAVSSGTPCVGIHAASDSSTCPVIDPFLSMLGGRFVTHGAEQKATMRVASPRFPGIKDLGDGFELFEEWYVLNTFARDMHVILVQETKGMQGQVYQRPPYPATWVWMHGKGRVFHTSMGHREDVWTNPIFQKIVLGGLSWPSVHVNTDITPNIHHVAPGVSWASEFLQPTGTIIEPHMKAMAGTKTKR